MKLLAMLMVTSLAMSAAACGDKPADGGNAGDIHNYTAYVGRELA